MTRARSSSPLCNIYGRHACREGMGCESIGWVLVYIAAFGVSDTLVAIVMPRLDRLLVWYSCIGIVGARMIIKSDGSNAMPRDDASQSAL